MSHSCSSRARSVLSKKLLLSRRAKKVSIALLMLPCLGILLQAIASCHVMPVHSLFPRLLCEDTPPPPPAQQSACPESSMCTRWQLTSLVALVAGQMVCPASRRSCFSSQSALLRGPLSFHCDTRFHSTGPLLPCR